MAPIPRADAVRSRERILTAATEVLARDPAASMDAVVTRSGLARVTVYRHFPTRDELVRVVADQALSVVGDLLEQAQPGKGEVLGAVTRVTAAALAAGGPAMTLVSLVASGQVRATEGASAARVEQLVTELVERGRHDGTLRDDVPVSWLVDLWFSVLQSALVHGAPAGGDAVALVVSVITGAATPSQDGGG